MKFKHLLLASGLVVLLAGVAYVAQQNESVGSKMTSAAEKLVGMLTADQKKIAMFPFDSKERTNWWFVPRQDDKKNTTRKGVALEDLTKEQKDQVLALLATGTSAAGLKKAVTIMSLEAILHELEAPKGTMVRKPGWYFVTIFGNPSKTGKWGWRIEGHHLSLNYTVENGQISSVTPTFFGANPAVVMAGAKKGLETLPGAEKLALKLFNMLDDEQKKVALQAKPFGEPQQTTIKPNVGAAVGLEAGKMTEAQQKVLKELVAAYAERMPADIAKVQLKQVKDAGFEKIHFAFTGTAASGKGHTYRVQGPTFVIEFLNVQADSAGNSANHIHSCWRNLAGDFGMEKS
jgi:hypothetical protein